MSEKRISDLLAPGTRFLRSAHLERDFHDSTALSGYVLTDFSRDCLSRMATGLKPRSGQRAWRVTGDYGSGKSSLPPAPRVLRLRRQPQSVGAA